MYGNIARPLAPGSTPADPNHSHEWTVFVKGLNDEDISYFVKKVVFKLHETYPNSTRTVEKPPFEVSETGWGEFEIQIKIHWIGESAEKPATVYHHLKLHPYGPNAEEEKATGATVYSQQYDEIVFNEPTEYMFDLLTRHGSALLPVAAANFTRRAESEELERLGNAMRKVEAQTTYYKEEISRLEKVQKAIGTTTTPTAATIT